MPIMTDLKTGEQKEVSMKEFLESIQGDDICIKQVLRNADRRVLGGIYYG